MFKRLTFSVAAIALMASAAHADIIVGVAGPVTGQYASFYEQMMSVVRTFGVDGCLI